jgi:hypothetical protein
MFRILEAARYGGPKVDYQGTPSQWTNNDPPKPLDPIDPATVGRVKVSRVVENMKVLQLMTIMTIVAIVVDGRCPEWVKEVPKRVRPPVVGEKYADHMEDLRKVGLVRGANRRRWPRYWSSYFAVPKGPENSRAIFNGKRLSSECPRPAPVNLLTHRNFLRKLQVHAQQNKSCWIVEGDLRHWFHQIPVGADLQDLFGLQTTVESLIWRCLPMGWSWSPLVAQALCWSFLLGRKAQQSPIFKEEVLKETGHLPFWLDYNGEGKGFGVVYYDNFFIAVGSQGDAKRVEKRLRENAAAFNIEVKGEICVHSDESLRTRGVKYLGMHIKLDSDHLIVRPTSLEEWSVLPPPGLSGPPSCRVAAGYVGRSLFATMIQEENLQASRNGRSIISLAREIGTAAAKNGWDSAIEETSVVPLEALWTSILALGEEPHLWPRGRLRLRIIRSELIIASDASKTGWGIVCLRRSHGQKELVVESEHQGLWTPVEAGRHIFLLELEVALRAVRMCRDIGKSDDSTSIVVDNVAVAWALRQGFTRNKVGQAMIEGAAAIGADTVGIGRILTVISADNPADSPSRGQQTEAARVAALEKALSVYDQGGMWASVPHALWTAEQRSSMVVHEGPCNSDSDEEGDV